MLRPDYYGSAALCKGGHNLLRSMDHSSKNRTYSNVQAATMFLLACRLSTYVLRYLTLRLGPNEMPRIFATSHR